MAVTAKAVAIEKNIGTLKELMARCTAEQIADYEYRLDMSWIHHDAAIEGVVYEPRELLAAINDGVVSDSTLIPVYDEIRQYKAAVDFARSLSKQSELEITVDTLRKLYGNFCPEGEDRTAPKFRKEMPLHRQYFHDIAQPDTIAPRTKELVKWMNNGESRRGIHVIRYASKVHHDLLHIFPFPKHSGRVARLVMNAILMHAGYPPVVLHATQRQAYYEALRQGPDQVTEVMRAALTNDVNSTLRFFNNLFGIPDTLP